MYHLVYTIRNKMENKTHNKQMNKKKEDQEIDVMLNALNNIESLTIALGVGILAYIIITFFKIAKGFF